MTQADRPALTFPMLQLAALAAVCASVVALAILGVRSIPLTLYTFGTVAGIVWGVLLLVGVGGAWALATMIETPAPDGVSLPELHRHRESLR